MTQSRYPYHDNSDVDSPRQCQSPSNMSSSNHQTTPPTPSSRIPNTLQAVFLASNRGRDVHKPPPERVAYKEFIRNWWGSVGQGSRNGSREGSREGSRNGSRWGSRRNSVAPSARTSAAPSAKATPVGSPLQGRNSSHNKKMTQKVSLLDDLGLLAAPMEAPVKMHKKKKARLPTLSPQQYLDAQCRSRGYSTERFCTLKTAYHNSPTPMQLASYDSYMISLVKQDQVGTLQRIYDTQLLSPNPCNQYGESLVHTICRLGHATMLQILLDAGADLQVADDYGRTPLHDACWGAEPNFACVRLILDRNPEAHVRLFYMTDARGAEPLTYVRREHWAAWIEFLESVKNDYWPKTPSVKNTTVAAAATAAQQQQPPPPLTLQEANTRLVIDPPHPKATKDLTRLIASGKMTPEEGLLLIEADDDDDDSSYSCGEEEDDDSDDSDDDDDESEKEDDSADFDAAEMKAFLQSVLPAEFTRAN